MHLFIFYSLVYYNYPPIFKVHSIDNLKIAKSKLLLNVYNFFMKNVVFK